MNKEICAGIVCYNPDIERLQGCINSIINQVDTLILVDNASKNKDDVIVISNKYKAVLIENDKNYGIGYGLNIILKYASENGYEWYLTLDQDSICSPGLITLYMRCIGQNVAQITCNIIDRKIGEIHEFGDGAKTESVNGCITSGSLNNTSIVSGNGGYNEKFFIDGVDVDLSIRLIKKGFQILKVDYNGLLHQNGDAKKIKLFSHEFIITCHKPWRNYYERRNFIAIARTYYKGIKKLKLIVQQIGYAFGISMLEDKKIDRIYYNFKGVIDGLNMNDIDRK